MAQFSPPQATQARLIAAHNFPRSRTNTRRIARYAAMRCRTLNFTMPSLVSDLALDSARRVPDRPALAYGAEQLRYNELANPIDAFAAQLLDLGVARMDRIAIYAEKRFETVIAMFGAARAGAVYVPVNPLLKAEQVSHIARDCAARVIVTTPERVALLDDLIRSAPSITAVIVMGEARGIAPPREGVSMISWPATRAARNPRQTAGGVADLLAASVAVAEAQVGDLVAVMQSGAYGLSASLQDFLSHPHAKEVLV